MSDADTMQMMVMALAAIAFSAVVFALMYPLVSGERQSDKRLNGIIESRAKAVDKHSAAEMAANRRKAVAESLKEIEIRNKAREKLTIRLQLQRAGWEMPLRTFYLASIVCGAVVGLITYMSMPAGILGKVVTVVAVFVGAFGLPRWYLKRAVLKRQIKFQRELANAIDVIVRGVKSGLPLNDCLGIIARESPEPLAGEFREVVEQQRIGLPMADAFEKMIERMPIAEVKFLAIVIAIQQQSGGNLSESLENLSAVLRDRFKLQMKVRALSAEAKASAGVLSSLPPAVMILLHFASPDYMVPLFHTRAGNFLILISLIWMGMGVLVMKKMINFKF
jgi:tight adherence protein B